MTKIIKINKTKYSSLTKSIKFALEYINLTWPNITRSNTINVLTVVKNMPNNVKNKKKEVIELTATKTINSGKNPDVPGNPTFANDIINK